MSGRLRVSHYFCSIWRILISLERCLMFARYCLSPQRTLAILLSGWTQRIHSWPLHTHRTHSVLETPKRYGRNRKHGFCFQDSPHRRKTKEHTHVLSECLCPELALWGHTEKTLLLLVKEQELFSDFPVLPHFYLSSQLNLSQSQKNDLIYTFKKFCFHILTFLLLPLFWGPSYLLHPWLIFPLMWLRCVSIAPRSTRR